MRRCAYSLRQAAHNTSPSQQSSDYRQLLIQSIHVCAIRFSEVAASVVHSLMDFLGDSNNPSALDVVAFVRCVLTEWSFLNEISIALAARW